MSHSYDDSRWPIVVSRAEGESTDADMEDYLSMLERMLARRERHVIIVDATGGKLLKGQHRKALAEWTRQNEAALRRYRAGLALVTSSAVLRGMITAVYWLTPAPFPYQPVSNMDEAWRWAEAQLVQRARLG
ncbi:MAG TPA: STAS/SEC14 domain-containing protein [Polyangiaceae bacterium]|nr:STAS/SEC14 domain-containing protein [Polyangiaceae bacterium]